MEKIYTKHVGKNKFFKACPETVRFLLDYSRSLHVLEHEEFQFESMLN
ncbi:hypothetical protein [Maribacter halichondriae]|nr:hypothetical protein [Maribacter sp. Hal144]